MKGIYVKINKIEVIGNNQNNENQISVSKIFLTGLVTKISVFDLFA